MQVRILGSAAGGGFPQWNCACSNCARQRAGKLHSRARTQTQVAISSIPNQWYLLGASPDLLTQLAATPELCPSAESSKSPVAGVILTSADVDSVMGLLHLREFETFTIFSTPSIRRILQDENSIFRVLERARPRVEWRDLIPRQRITLNAASPSSPPSSIQIIPIATHGSYPDYVSPALRSTLPAAEASLALRIEANGYALFFAPALAVNAATHAALNDARASDVVLLDGTFWTDTELQATHRSNKSAREIGHLPLSGRDGLLAHFDVGSSKTCRKILIHINNTNPIIDEDSPEYRAVREAGWEIAYDGMSIDL
jgi:pyrroloquinoline quinone biosynthesis protein B